MLQAEAKRLAAKFQNSFKLKTVKCQWGSGRCSTRNYRGLVQKTETLNYMSEMHKCNTGIFLLHIILQQLEALIRLIRKISVHIRQHMIAGSPSEFCFQLRT